MRVIAGIARSVPLATVEGDDTRPTTDRIKETLFNVLQGYTEDSVFLDLFSGSGQIGIEALSRGAKRAVFVEQAAGCIQCIQANLTKTKLKDRAKVMKMDVLAAIRTLAVSGDVFDVIFLDPPYRKGMEADVLQALADSSIVSDGTLIVVEAAKEEDFSYVEDLGFQIVKNKIYKSNQHVFLKKIGER